jgi:diacylglycerol kinase family enzyme
MSIKNAIVLLTVVCLFALCFLYIKDKIASSQPKPISYEFQSDSINNLVDSLNQELFKKDGKIIKIDSGKANEQFFINVAGAGFDAHVSHQFAHAHKRGFKSYAKITLHEFKQYECENYSLIIDDKPQDVKAFIICVANGSQYGNNAYIAPSAQVHDGKFELTVLKPFSIWQIPRIGLQLFMGTLNSSKLVDAYHFHKLKIIREREGVFNIDGEAIWMPQEINIQIKPASIQIIVP